MGIEIDLSVAITAHNEGLVAHKTMRSVFRALEKLKEAGITYEVIVHIDFGSKETVEYFSRYRHDENIKIYENQYGDLGLSRNYVTTKARGKYIAFLDGDDLVSDNWYLEAIRLLESTKDEIVVHPEAVLTFGVEQPNVITLQSDSYNIEKDTLVLLGENRWCSVAVAKKTVFLKHPYKKMGKGYSFEDYAFNTDTVSSGIRHRVAKGTVLFYRKSGNSMLDKANGNSAVLPYASLFDFEVVKKYKSQVEVEDKKILLKKRGYKLYKKIRNNSFLNYFITPVAKATLKVLESGRNAGKNLPDWVVEEWIKINSIESQLYPFSHIVNGVQKYSADEYIGVGEAYAKIAKVVTKKPDYVFIVPWLVRGGGDKVLLNYIEALREVHLDWHFAVISTLPAKNIWVKLLPKQVDFIDFGNIAFDLNPDMQDKLLSRIITQLQCRRLHIINSEFGYTWARKHQELIKSEYELNVSLFCGEFIPGSDMRGVFSYANPCLFEIFPVVKNVFTDNDTIIRKVMDENGFDDKKFKVHYQPIDFKITDPKNQLVDGGKLKILWAGRVTATKMPELVAKIGRGLDPRLFSLDVYGEKSKELKSDIFDGIAAIKYCGPFDGFSSIPTENYDMLLYTSMDDGVPNIILEATAAGLPIIASSDGGVGEFIINGKTGILIEDFLDDKAYIEAINNVRKDPDPIFDHVKQAQKKLFEQHSWEQFIQKVKDDFD
ncbi:glycosyltransferase [Candidatus Saccharibacteria bacterium]|nr:glycosyltransferase [Candidatus Saccharibacteria bacterium]